MMTKFKEDTLQRRLCVASATINMTIPVGDSFVVRERPRPAKFGTLPIKPYRYGMSNPALRPVILGGDA